MASHHHNLYLFLSLITLFSSIHSHIALASNSNELQNYIIHMDSSAMPKAFTDHHSWFISTLSSLSDSSSTPNRNNKLIYTYTHAMHGFSARLSISELEAIKASPGYLHSTRDSPVKKDTTHSIKFLGLGSNPNGAWAESNYGDGIIIGLLDTGIWPESKSFSDEGMPDVPTKWKGKCEPGTNFKPSQLCNKKLVGARFFNRGLIATNPNITISMNSTRDTEGHGTHTSSTAAGTSVHGASYFNYAPGTARGVAPRAHVAMYKALWDEGAVSSDIIAGIDAAIKDGVDVLSLSLGIDGVPLYDDPIAVSTFSATERGVFVATSAGNEGPFYSSLHNGIPWVTTVAAGTIDRSFEGRLNLIGDEGGSIYGAGLFPGNSTGTRVPIVFMESCEDQKKLKKLGRKIVVCDEAKNGTSLSDQFRYVKQAKVHGGVFVTDDDDLELYIQSSFPAIFISVKDGEIVKSFIKKKTKKKAKASMVFGSTVIGTRPAPMATSYTSRGPSPSVPAILKPDLMAPGSLILAAWPPNISDADVGSRKLYSEFNLLSGTSMACPHVAGVGALIRRARPEWSPAAIRSAIMTTSDITDNDGSFIKDIGMKDEPASPLAIGSGHINPNKALTPGLVYEAETKDYVSLLCALNYSREHIKMITKLSGSLSDCSKISKPSLDLNYPSFIAFFNANESRRNNNSGDDETVVREFQRTVTNVDDGKSSYVARLTAMEGFEVKVEPERLLFSEKGEKKRFKLRIEGPKTIKQTVAFGYLTWVGNYQKSQRLVRSPIVATRLDSKPIS